jgi:Zn-dependent protease
LPDSLTLARAVIFVAMFLILSGPVHECAHAYVAWKLGDGTAKLFGRVTLDPFKHFDPVGGSLLAATVIIGALTGFPYGFGWAKPTPVNPYNLRGRHADSMVSVAGPISNLVLAVAFAVGFRILLANGILPDNTSVINMVQLVMETGIILNIILMVFNLIPIPPLDGSHVLFDFLDPRTSHELQGFLNQYGFMILVLFIFLGRGLIFSIMSPIVNFLAGAQIY